MGSELLNPLMHQVASSPVFGDSFAISPAQQDIMAGQMGMAIRAFSEETTAIFSQGMPEAPAERVTELVKSLIVTSVGFGAGLSAGELQDTSLVADLAILIGVTGWGNFLCDQKDEPMTYAISLLCGREVEVPEHLVGQTHSRLDGLRHIESKIQKIARPEDVPYLLRASRDELMLCEILAHELSEGLAAANAQDSFLAKHAERAADILTVTAALPSAITPLYGAYRRENPDLPMLQEVYGDPLIHEFLRRANVFVRVFDDLGDRGIDQQAFSLNVFNQAQ
ncbi:MAG TPA: hypothetical protein VFM05_10505, partial [Candidatus Saccharimonadales bacterium]|nr:hypothetical protein [Candidatus Saccharimonadales bacterium]